MNFLSRFLATTVITFTDFRCAAVKGKVESRILREVADCLREGRDAKAEIWIGGDGRARFSKRIPPELHQRLRNILARI